MRLKFYLLLLFIILLNQNNASESPFIFPRTIYIKNQETFNMIKIETSIPKDQISLYFKLSSEKNYSHCYSDYNTSIFNCLVNKKGEYYFKYKYKKEEIKIENKVSIYESLNDIFNIIPSKDSKCFYNKELLSYTLNLKENVKVNLNNIQLYAYSPISEIMKHYRRKKNKI